MKRVKVFIHGPWSPLCSFSPTCVSWGECGTMSGEDNSPGLVRVAVKAWGIPLSIVLVYSVPKFQSNCCAQKVKKKKKKQNTKKQKMINMGHDSFKNTKMKYHGGIIEGHHFFYLRCSRRSPEAGKQRGPQIKEASLMENAHITVRWENRRELTNVFQVIDRAGRYIEHSQYIRNGKCHLCKLTDSKLK